MTVVVVEEPEGANKYYRGFANGVGYGETCSVEYAIPADKTFYVCGMAAEQNAAAAADYDHFLYVKVEVQNLTDGIYLATMAGIGGAGLIFPKPLKIAGGKTMKFWGVNMSNISCNIVVLGWGYEV